MILVNNLLIINGVEIHTREVDGYVYATQLCELNKKRFTDWKMFGTTKLLIKQFKTKFDTDINLYDVKKGGGIQGSWIHPVLLIHLLEWIFIENVNIGLLWLKQVYGDKYINIINEIKLENNIKELQINQIVTLPKIVVNKQNQTSLIDQMFAFTDKPVKVYGTTDAPYFRAKDIALILEYTNTNKAIVDNVRDKNKKSLREISDILGVTGSDSLNINELNTIYLTEAGLYELIMKSQMSEAVKFQDWVFEEVLPSIRKDTNNKLLQELKQKEDIISKQQIENKWLHISAKYNANFNIRTVKAESLYVGAHPTEAKDYIYKIGKSLNAEQRQRAHSASTTLINNFQMSSTYTTYVDLALSIEKFIHAILDPLSANINSSRTEHYIAHPVFLDKIINKILHNVDDYVDDVNAYINLLKDNKFNYEAITNLITSEIVIKPICNCVKAIQIQDIKPIIQEDDEPESTAEKICNGCHITKSIYAFEIYRKDFRAASCITCRNTVMIQCNKCKVSKLGMNFKVKDDYKRQQGCTECVPTLVVLKKCQKCSKSKTSDNYDIAPNGQKNRYCIECKVYKKNCLKCKESKTNWSLTPIHEVKQYCDDCYTDVKEKNKYKKCTKCTKILLKSLFSQIDGYERNRICDTCRNI